MPESSEGDRARCTAHSIIRALSAYSASPRRPTFIASIHARERPEGNKESPPCTRGCDGAEISFATWGCGCSTAVPALSGAISADLLQIVQIHGAQQMARLQHQSCRRKSPARSECFGLGPSDAQMRTALLPYAQQRRDAPPGPSPVQRRSREPRVRQGTNIGKTWRIWTRPWMARLKQTGVCP